MSPRKSAGLATTTPSNGAGFSLQIPPSPLRPHFVRATVRVHEYPDGRLAVFHMQRRLAGADPQGNRRDDAKLAA